MKLISTEAEIAATAERVWDILADLESYPEWNPFIKSVQGQLEEGASLDVRINTMRFRPRILRVDPPRELRWKGAAARWHLRRQAPL